MSEINTKLFTRSQPRGTKRWVLSERKSKLVVMQNKNVEASYHEVLKLVKRLYLKPNEVFCERDLRYDYEQGLFGIHTLVTASFYWFLLCDLCYNYQVLYAFGNCPYAAEVRAKLRAYPLDRQAQEYKLKTDYHTFYNNVLKIQEPRYLFTLTGNHT